MPGDHPADLGAPTAHWSLEDLAYHILRQAHYRDVSRSTVWRVLNEVQLRPHKSRYWLHSDAPDFEAKVLDICRLYLDAPRLYRQGELVVCVDEKTGSQALERARPTRPGQPGRDERRDHEYVRHGTCCLLASRAAATGRVIGSITAQRGRWDFVGHLRDVSEQFPQVQRFHWVMDNLNTHWSFELCQYLDKLSGVWDGRPSLRTGGGTPRLPDGCDASARSPFHAQARELDEPDRNMVRGAQPSRARPGRFRLADGAAAGIEEFIGYYNAHDSFSYEWTYSGKPLTGTRTQARRHRIRYGRRRLCLRRPTLNRRF